MWNFHLFILRNEFLNHIVVYSVKSRPPHFSLLRAYKLNPISYYLLCICVFVFLLDEMINTTEIHT
jgi:hypothetical protein